MNYQLFPSILSADFSSLRNDIKILERNGIRSIHIDVMDGHFVPNITVGPCVIERIRECTDLFFDVHLMLEKPQDHIEAFIRAGADSLTVHWESLHNVENTFDLIRKHGKRVGLAINPDTPCEKVKSVLDSVDMVLVMSVFPGFSGQSFIKSSLEKIREIRRFINSKNLQDQIDLQVDGGLNKDTLNSVKEAGANMFVIGSYLFKDRTIAHKIKELETVISVAKRKRVPQP